VKKDNRPSLAEESKHRDKLTIPEKRAEDDYDGLDLSKRNISEPLSTNLSGLLRKRNLSKGAWYTVDTVNLLETEHLDQMMRGSVFFQRFSCFDCLCTGTVPLEVAVFKRIFKPE
jgi:hypothetical protein